MAELVYPPVIGTARTMFKALDLRFDIKGTENVPQQGGAVLVSNHIGYLDFVFCRAHRAPGRSGWCASWRRSRSSGTRSPDR